MTFYYSSWPSINLISGSQAKQTSDKKTIRGLGSRKLGNGKNVRKMAVASGGAKFGDESWDFPDWYLISDVQIPILRNDKMQLEILRQ